MTSRHIPIVPTGPNSTSRKTHQLASSVSLLAALPPLSLYVHIPWCVRKCPYCDFNSHEIKPAQLDTAQRGDTPALKSPWPRPRPGASHAESNGHVNSQKARIEIPEDAYIEALTRDLEQALPLIWGRRIYSIFFGGGTPSLLSPLALDTLLANLRARLPLEYCSEITLEANPGTFESAKFAAYRASGVNRLSIGIQSFDPRHLQALGRIHDDKEAHRAIEIAQRNFDNFNLDIMYALPGQTLTEAARDIDTAIAAAPTHISAYQLTLEPNTLFHRYPPALPGDDAAEEMQTQLETLLEAAGYHGYETSAFAQPGRQCRHNRNYWQFGDYLGIGAGAASKISFPDRIVRSLRAKQPKAYMESVASGAHIVEQGEVSLAELPFEFMLNALRLTDGFPTSLFAERTGLPLTVVKEQLDLAERRGLIERDALTVRPTQRGRRFLNDLLQSFLPGVA